MGRRKTGKEAPQEEVVSHGRGENGEDDEGDGRKGAGFYACYLLTSMCPRFKGHTYIGFTVNPKRRIRQHNGEIASGAFRTKKRRPWEMVLCIYGFPTNVSALQFEWAWQHPIESLAVRAAAVSFKSLSGLANKIKLAYTMLSLPPWQSLNITVNLFSTKYQEHTCCCPALPQQMRTRICSMDELPCYNLHSLGDELLDDDEYEGNNDELCGECSSQEQVRKLQHFPEKDGESEEYVHHNGNASFTRTPPVSCSTSYEETEEWLLRWDELPTEIDGPVEKQSTTALVAPREQLFISSASPYIAGHKVEIIDIYPDTACHEVETIDILSPTSSPCYHVKLGSKRRKPSHCPEIIDLTNSPVFVCS